MWDASVQLIGVQITLTPLALGHIPGLCQAVSDGDLHRLWFTTAPAPIEMEEAVKLRLSRASAGLEAPFVIVRNADGCVLGATNYLVLDQDTPRVEIGGTWIAASGQRTRANTEAKRLLLGHAFEDLSCAAVEFRTHALNLRSRAAIERLGARLDGILRNHRRCSNGTLRDTCCYSIIASEWLAVRAHLDHMLEQTR